MSPLGQYGTLEQTVKLNDTSHRLHNTQLVTFSIMTLSIKAYFETFEINGTLPLC
jgi:hypothetical protein